MTIKEMKYAIALMNSVCKFKDESTDIFMGDPKTCTHNLVTVYTKVGLVNVRMSIDVSTCDPIDIEKYKC